ncbi:sulfatase [Labilibacter sediminis]|nr:sulfatase [Labilibacter sediminis]
MFFCFLCSIFAFSVKKSKTKDRPNVLFIMSDDHTSQAFGVYGSRLASLNPTPIIDRLAHEGIVFENAFCTNSICTPSRASILTGQYSQTNGVLTLNGHLPEARQHLSREMNALGYETAVIGKWHLKDAPSSFDYYNVLYGQGKYFDPVMNVKGNRDSLEIIENRQKRKVPGIKYKGHSTDVITDISLNWLENREDNEAPFCLFLHYKAPHEGFDFAPRYANYLEDVEIPEPESLWDNQNNGSIATKGVNNSLIDTIGSSIGRRNVVRNMASRMRINKKLDDDAYKKAAYQEYLKRYLRCVKGIDDNVKRVFDYLERTNQMDNTIIVYTGDQGFFLGEHDYIDKRWMYEESIRMPLLIRYPKVIKAGTRSDAIVNNTDFAPTILNLAGGTTPEYMQGASFDYILKTGKEPEGWKQATYYRYWMHMAHRHNVPAHFGIRTKRYKLIFLYGINFKEQPVNPKTLEHIQTPVDWEFYDLSKDPFEMDNRYDDPAYAKEIADLKNQLKQLRSELREEDENYPVIQQIINKNW